MTDLETAPLLDRYLLRERIARGGMGEVFRAVAVGADGFEKPVVVKRILPMLGESDRLVRLFTSEAKLMTHLVHPNIVQVLDFGRGRAGEYFMVLELVDGMDLGRFRRSCMTSKEPVSVALALYVVGQMLRGLAFAHESSAQPLVHRDVSPGNVLLSRLGEVKLADFGVALARAPEGATDTLVVGKPRYMAPEQLHGGIVDPRADLFAAGIVLFELLTNELPFVGKTLAERSAGISGGVRSCSELVPEIGTRFDAFFARALAHRPDDRFQTAREMSLELGRLRESAAALVDAEDLALAVTRTLAREPRTALPVVMLGDGPAATSGVLTRVTVAERGSVFSVEMPGDKATVAEPRRTSRAVAWGLLAALAAGAAAFLVFLGARSHTEPPVGAPPATVPPPIQSLLASSSPPSIVPPSATANPPRVTETQKSTKRVLAADSAAPAPSAADECRGEVQLHSTAGSWSVSGGPFPVQAPGRYTWPCGTFHLSAVSRMDPTKNMQLVVRVKDSGRSVHELR